MTINNWAATTLLIIATALFCVAITLTFMSGISGAANPNWGAPTPVILGTLASLGTGLSLIMFYGSQGRRHVTFLSSATLFLIGFVFLTDKWIGAGSLQTSTWPLIIMLICFVVATALYLSALGDWKFLSRLTDGAKSLWGAPRWVFIWVMFILSPVNMAGLFFLDHPLGIAACLGLIYIFFTNIPLLLAARGVNTSMSIPHLVPFGLIIALSATYLFTDIFPALKLGTPLYAFAWTLLVINSISFAFDLLDSWRWTRGQTANIPPRA